MKIGSVMIPADITDILEKLKEASGNPRFFKRSGKNVQIPCPYHKDGEERKPSCGILTEDTWSNGKLYREGQVHCFTCGHTVPFEEFVSNLLGKNDGGKEGYRWLVKNFLSIEVEQRDRLKVDMTRKRGRGKARKEEIKYIPDEKLDTYRYFHSYMYERKLTDEVIDLFDVGYDEAQKALTFPVHHHINGKAFMIQRRSTVSKFFKNPPEMQKTLTVYGLWQVLQAIEKGERVDRVYITESIIDALTVWSYGGYAVSLMGLGGNEQYDLLRKIPIRAFVKALDNDAAGEKAMENLKNEIGKDKLLYSFVYPKGKKDMNDLSREEFRKAERKLYLF